MNTTSTARPSVPPGEGASGRNGRVLTRALASEWSKLWSVRSTWWSLAAAVALALVSAVAISYIAVGDQRQQGADAELVSAGDVASTSVQLIQFAFVALAMLTITGEYACGSIRTTLCWTPQRGSMLAAKVAVVSVVAFGVGTALALFVALLSRPLMGEFGSFDAADTVARSFRIGGYLALLSAMTVGLGAVLRSTGATLTTLILLQVIGTALQGVPSDVLVGIGSVLPAVAGMNFMAGVDTSGTAYPPGTGFAILAAWTAASLLAAYVALRNRDA